MKFARRKADGELVFAEDYLNTDESPHGFCCPYDGCAIDLKLKSYKSKHQKAPYFAKPQGEKHLEECPIINQYQNQKNRSNGIDTSFPLPQISKLILENEAISQSLGNNKLVYKSTNNSLFHNRTTKYLAPIVRWYLQNYDRGKKQLDVPGCSYTTYESIFQRISFSSKTKYKGTHIFFGSLYLKNPFEVRDNEIIFNLYQGQDREPIKLIVYTYDWKENSKIFIISSTEKAIVKCKEDYQNGVKNVYPYIFFLGNANQTNGRVFNCNKHKAIYVTAIPDLHLNSKNCGIDNFSQASVKINSDHNLVSDTTECDRSILNVVEQNSARQVANLRNTRDYRKQKQPKLSFKKGNLNSIYPQNHLQSQNTNKTNSRVKKRKKGNFIKRITQSIKYFIKKIKSVFDI